MSDPEFRRFAILHACYHLVVLILLIAGLGALHWLLGVLPELLIPPLTIFLIFLFMELWQLNRIIKSDLPVTKNPVVTLHPDEQIIDTITGLHTTGWWIRGKGLLHGSDFAARVNAMVLTDRQILLVVVPLDGVELLLINIGPERKRSRGEVEGRLREMLASDGLEALPSQYGLPYENIQVVEFTLSMRRIKFVTENGVFRYKIWEKRDFVKATELLDRFRAQG